MKRKLFDFFILSDCLEVPPKNYAKLKDLFFCAGRKYTIK
jgi:hypothetical protein